MCIYLITRSSDEFILLHVVLYYVWLGHVGLRCIHMYRARGFALTKSRGIHFHALIIIPVLTHLTVSLISYVTIHF